MAKTKVYSPILGIFGKKKGAPLFLLQVVETRDNLNFNFWSYAGDGRNEQLSNGVYFVQQIEILLNGSNPT